MARSIKIVITNLRKHEVRLSDDFSIPPLGKIEMLQSEYQEILRANRFIRSAVNKRFLKATIKNKKGR